MARNLSHYTSLNYPIELVREEGMFVALHPDLPGCVAQGESADEAVANLDDAREAWLKVRVEDQLFIAEPISEEFSGRFSFRMPASLHESLARRAQREGVSLNSYIVATLAGAHSAGEVIERAEAQFAALRSSIETSLMSLTTSALHSYKPDRLLVGDRIASPENLWGRSQRKEARGATTV